jgi:DNA-binding SARP family transcriptional activator
METIDDDGTWTPIPFKPRLLLAILLVHKGGVIAVDTLIDQLWDHDPPPTARQALRVYVSQLRRILATRFSSTGCVLITQAPGYRLDFARWALDLFEFEDLQQQGREAWNQARYELASSTYQQALDLWRGPALADVRTGHSLDGIAQRLDEVRNVTLVRRIDADLRLGRHLDLISELRGLVSEFPLHEGLIARLMVALFRSGRSSEALNLYLKVRVMLIESLGIEPGRDLSLIHHSVLSADHAALETSNLWTQ